MGSEQSRNSGEESSGGSAEQPSSNSAEQKDSDSLTTGRRRNDFGQAGTSGSQQKNNAQHLSNKLAAELQQRIDSDQMKNSAAADTSSLNALIDFGQSDHLATGQKRSDIIGQLTDEDDVSAPVALHLTNTSKRLHRASSRIFRSVRRRRQGLPDCRRHLRHPSVFSGPPGSSLSAEEEKCYDPDDTTLEFVDGEDDMDFECNNYKSLRARMSCGHTVTPMSLTKWCCYLLDQDKSKFVCGQPDCDAEWSYKEVCKMALLTPEEIEYFENKLFQRAATDYLHVKRCPGCKSSVIRTDLDNLRVWCTECTKDKKRPYEFCWQCLREWKDPSRLSYRCAYDDCIDKLLQILKNCKTITFRDVEGVSGCPSIRACPTCGLLIEHNKKKCKNIICPRCKVEFCFVCLKLTEECLETSEHFIHCSSGVAPRQTSVPVWKKN